MIKITPHIFYLLCIVYCCINTSCTTENKPEVSALFTVLTSDVTGLNFTNTLKPTPEFNMLKYMYYYNGAGAATGDFNNDGKIDMFFASNQGQNSLYLNEGKMHFKDVTKEAQIPTDGGWSTGVSVVDINNDGLLDIYVCRVGNFKILHGKNQLLVCTGIKNGIPVYKDETGKYGLDFSGFSTQAAFLDYDNDGDLDMFLLNHSVNHDGNFVPRNIFLNTYDSLAGDQFFRNDNGHYNNITKQCGINSTKIGYGLGIAISDINLDGWPDIYIGNDFHENDYLYINQKNGTFKEELNEHIMHTSQFSMGVDVADINNDAFPDIISMDMLPYDPYILKRSLAEDEYQTFKSKLGYGYNYQYARNNLQLNQRNGMFVEVAFYSGVFATDWSWSSLWMDFDNDGKKDLFISNGIPKRLNDIDYVTYMINDVVQSKLVNNKMDENDLAMIDKFPKIKLPNRFFKNAGNAKFEDVSNAVAQNPNTFSNGAVYADLDNDGDLDIVVNNILDPALIYENNATVNKNFANIKLTGQPGNINAVGTKCYVFGNAEISSYEKFATKGFLSSMEMPLHIGFGNGKVDSILLVWPDNTYQKINKEDNNRNWSFSWRKGLPLFDYKIIAAYYKPGTKPMKDITVQTGLKYLHEENVFNEYNREILLPRMFGTEGPALAVADINGDGLDDVFVGSSKWKASAIFVQNKNGTFVQTNQPQLNNDSTYEDVDACFADVNNDGFKDLIVASGGNEFYAKEQWLQPRVYLNNGKGNFTRLDNAFPDVYGTQSCIKASDFNKDGFIDFFIGARATPFAYGKIPTSYLLQNDGTGHFKIVTNDIARGLSTIGFITNATWADINNDKADDLVVTLEWGGIESFINTKGNFIKKTITDKKGWWNFATPVDVDGDGDLDFIAGNEGQNCRLQPTAREPLQMYYNDFDNNGTKEQVISFFLQGREIPLASKMDLEKQMPFIKKKYLYAADFSKASLKDIFTAEKINSADVFSATYFSNAVLINDGKGNFAVKELPWQAQLSCLKDAVIIDANGDALPDILTGGNFYEQAMDLNRSDADFGTILINQGKGSFAAQNINGLVIKNEIRHILPIRIKNNAAYIIARNNDSLMVIQ
ncbi:VCBS repeat-containing protein [Ferruginibacter sp.]|nr:VCBS repeat-containing protein [Ferruginibacter sp.]